LFFSLRKNFLLQLIVAALSQVSPPWTSAAIMDICGLFGDDFTDVQFEDDFDDAKKLRKPAVAGGCSEANSELRTRSDNVQNGRVDRALIQERLSNCAPVSLSSNVTGTGWWTKRLEANWGTELDALSNKTISYAKANTAGKRTPKRVCVFSLSDRPWLYEITYARMREYCELHGYAFEARHRFVFSFLVRPYC
jgi:hypothetical protein